MPREEEEEEEEEDYKKTSIKWNILTIKQNTSGIRSV